MQEQPKSAPAQHTEDAVSAALVSQVCQDLPIAPANQIEIYRYLGYRADTAPAPRVAEQISAIVAEALECLRPRGAYSVYQAANRTAHSLQLADTTISGNIGEYLEAAGRVAVFAVTAGEEISHRSEAASRRGDALSAWTLDAAGSWAVEAAADALMLRIRRHLHGGQELTLRYSPGYCGMDIGQQRNLFHLMQAGSIGVTLMPSMLMHPLKSISGLVGLAPKEAASHQRSPCDLCQRDGCHMRR